MKKRLKQRRLTASGQRWKRKSSHQSFETISLSPLLWTSFSRLSRPETAPRRGSFVLAGPPAVAPTHARCCVLLKCRCSFLFIIKKGFDFLQFVLMPQLLTPSGRAVISAANTPLFNQRQRTPATNIEEFFGVLELHRYATAEMHLKTLTMETNLFFFPRKGAVRAWKCVSALVSAAVSVLCLQLQKRKEREEQLEDVIQAYEKIHMEKSNLQRDLDKMVRHVSVVHVAPWWCSLIWQMIKRIRGHSWKRGSRTGFRRGQNGFDSHQ